MHFLVVVSVLVLVERSCRLVGPPSAVLQGLLLEFLLGNSPLEVAWGASVFADFHLLVASLV